MTVMKLTDPARVSLVPTAFYTRHPCHVCGGCTEKVSVLAEVLRGSLAGLRVCENCLRRVEDGESIDAMLDARADALFAHAPRDAARLRGAVGRLRVPTYRQWARATLEHDYRSMRAACEASRARASGSGTDDLDRNALLDLFFGHASGNGDLGMASLGYALAAAIADGSLRAEDVMARAAELAYPLRDAPSTVGADSADVPL